MLSLLSVKKEKEEEVGGGCFKKPTIRKLEEARVKIIWYFSVLLGKVYFTGI